MTQVIAIDGGNFETKIVHTKGFDVFNSSIGEWTQRKAGDTHSKQDMDFHIINKYDNIRGFAGPLASLESEYGGTVFGTSKNHLDARIRILLGVARNLSDYMVNLIVGQPYISHTEDEKSEIVKSLVGRHKVIINNKEREFEIQNVFVGIEGAMAFWSSPYDGPVNVIDVGSGTVNCIHFLNKRIVDRKSNTLPFGSETNKNGVNFEGMASAVFKNMSNNWDKNHKTLICGGSAHLIFEPLKKYYPNAQLIEPRVNISSVSMPLDTKFANAVGMFILGSKVYGAVQAG